VGDRQAREVKWEIEADNRGAERVTLLEEHILDELISGHEFQLVRASVGFQHLLIFEVDVGCVEDAGLFEGTRLP
jgi:hypothetical protein